MNMHEWEKQEKLLDIIESTEVENCLQYSKFNYEKHEWDNIPVIVPKYVIYLSKYMNGVCNILDEVYSRETTKDLRYDMENKN